MKRHFLLATLIIFVAFSFVVASQASVLNYYLDLEYSGATEPEGPPPWLQATFDDEGTLGSVKLTMETNLVGNEYVKVWAFNLEPNLSPSALDIQYDSGQNATVTTGVNFFKAGGDGRYDIKFSFPTSNSLDRFEGDESSIWIFSGIPSLNANSFNFLSQPAGGQGPYPTAAHVGSIGLDNEGSGWIATPISDTVWLFGAGLICILGLRSRAYVLR